MSFTTAEEFDKAFSRVKAGFASGRTKHKAWRREKLKRCWWMLEDNRERIVDVLLKDLNKHRQEAFSSDINSLQADILHTLQNLSKWTADERPARYNFLNYLGNTTVRKEPLGVTLIIGAWNFPFTLLLGPMIAAIASGCAMVLKPSEIARASQDFFMEVIPQYLDPDAIQVVTAGPQEMGHILEQRFDHIFYTGSPNVAKIVAVAAMKHLTPVTLELGGQGPAIVTKTADISLSAKRIAAAKFTNAGQICLTVNHVFVDPEIKDTFLMSLCEHFDTFCGGSDKNRPSYLSRIVNKRNFDRLDRLLQQSEGEIVYGGDRDVNTLYFGPTVVTGVDCHDSLLSEELFGPILPVIEADLETAMAMIRSMEHPLAVYGYTQSSEEKKRILDGTLSGGVTFNDCFMHCVAQDAPFGGVGTSGMGYYHGPEGIRAFSHLRTFIDPPTWLDKIMAARYPPYTDEKIKKARSVKAPFDRDGREYPSFPVRLLRGVVFAALPLGVGYWFWKLK